MEELRRISVGTIDESQSFNMQEVIDAFWLSKEKNDNSLLKKILLPVENFLFYKKLVIKDSAANAIKSGAKLMAPGLVDAEKEIKEGELVKIYNESGIFVGMATSLYSTDELKKRKKGQIVKVERIHL